MFPECTDAVVYGTTRTGHPTAAVQVGRTIYRAVSFTCVAARDRFMAAAAGHPDVVNGRVSVALYCEESGADQGQPLYSLPSTSGAVQMIDNLPSTMSEGEFVKVMLVRALTSLILCGELCVKPDASAGGRPADLNWLR